MKSGIEYFPLDVHVDDNLELIQAEFGIKGFGIVIRLWQKIYSQGYYLEWTDEVALMFARLHTCGNINVVEEVVRACVRRGIFDKGLFDKHRVLTSRGIQKRYLEAIKRRKNTSIDRKYLLAKADANIKNVNKSGENVNKNDENADIPQVKGEESRLDILEPPPFSEVERYANELGYGPLAKGFYTFYDASGWLNKHKESILPEWKPSMVSWGLNEERFSGTVTLPKADREVYEIIE